MVIPESCQIWIDKQRTKKEKFEDTIKHDYNLIKNYLPTECKKVLDIGCGIGGIDILLHRHYDIPPVIYLYDFADQAPEYKSKIQYGFNETYKGYNSMIETAKFMKANAVYNYHYVNAKYGLPKELNDFDIIISLLSWGYHYPVETYIDDIIPMMREDGILILDIRDNTDGIKKVEKYFRNIKIIATENKANKIIAKGIKW